VTTEQRVREYVYERTAASGRPPLAAEVGEALGATRDEVLERFRELRGRRLLALGGDSGEIVMAPPFSAVPTGFRVFAGGRSYFANCVWDAYGIAAALHRDAEVEASCGCCGDPMTMAVAGERPVATDGVAHFAVPAAEWWDAITYT